MINYIPIEILNYELQNLMFYVYNDIIGTFQEINMKIIKEDKYFMKKILFLLISIIILFPSNVFADMGPKPSITISIHGIEETAYMTLLSKEKSSGPFQVYEKDESDFKEYGTQDAWQAFVNYQDKDGFYFLQYFQLCKESFQWSYYPPDEFKVLIYFPESKTFIISPESYKRYAFESFFTVNLIHSSQNLDVTSAQSQKMNIFVKENYIWNEAMLRVVMRMLLTVIIEVGIALMMKIKKKREIGIIIGTNILTQVIFNLLLEITGVYSLGIYGILFYILFEIFIVWIEISIYKKTFKVQNKTSIKTYTIIANSITFMIGFMI